MRIKFFIESKRVMYMLIYLVSCCCAIVVVFLTQLWNGNRFGGNDSYFLVGWVPKLLKDLNATNLKVKSISVSNRITY